MNFSNDDNKPAIVSIGHIDLSSGRRSAPIDESDLPILPTRNLVLFPGVTIPITLGRPNSLKTAQLASEHGISIGIVCQSKPEIEHPSVPDDLYQYGVVADVIQIFNLPDGTHSAIVKAREKFKITGAGARHAIPEAELSASIKLVKETSPRKNDKEFMALVASIKDTTLKILKQTPDAPDDMIFNLSNFEDPVGIVNMVSTHLPMDIDVKMKLMTLHRVKDRAFMLLTELSRSEQMVEILCNIQSRARENMTEQQRSAFLQQQMEAIRQELYGDSDDADNMSRRAETIEFPENVRKTFDKELEKLRRLNPSSPDYSVQYSYLETLLDLPWNANDPDNTDFSAAKDILNADHYGLDKVKDRILEQLAVIMNNPGGKAPILCLVGAPGVGKTSLGQSVARAMGRKYQRVSLGGLHDEAEIRGHRRTYIGAMPGRIIDAMKRAGSTNPVLLLDEVDKIGQDFKGDPSAALLEVLDPEQNCHFHDNYIDVDYDLSNVLFIATANTLSTLSQPLLDRMEVIDISGYLLEEKVEIARRHLIPRLLGEHNLETVDVTFTDDALVKIVECYTSESGVRQLEKQLAAVIRKVILKKMNTGSYNGAITVDNLKDYLGAERYSRDRYEGNDFAGVVTGLAWTAVGGEILYIESSLSEGKGEKLTLTGNLGNVMKESAVIALQYVRSHASQLGIDTSLFDKYNLHIHVPEGAIPKDGPSAGITMATSIVSAFTQHKVRERVAMTGEITLRGKVLPVGGIKEKILAAKRAGITDIVLSNDNRKNIAEISEKYLDGLTFHYVDTVKEVVDFAVTDQPAIDAITL